MAGRYKNWRLDVDNEPLHNTLASDFGQGAMAVYGYLRQQIDSLAEPFKPSDGLKQICERTRMLRSLGDTIHRLYSALKEQGTDLCETGLKPKATRVLLRFPTEVQPFYVANFVKEELEGRLQEDLYNQYLCCILREAQSEIAHNPQVKKKRPTIMNTRAHYDRIEKYCQDAGVRVENNGYMASHTFGALLRDTLQEMNLDPNPRRTIMPWPRKAAYCFDYEEDLVEYTTALAEKICMDQGIESETDKEHIASVLFDYFDDLWHRNNA